MVVANEMRLSRLAIAHRFIEPASLQGRASLMANEVDFSCGDSTPTQLDVSESPDLISMPFAAQVRPLGSGTSIRVSALYSRCSHCRAASWTGHCAGCRHFRHQHCALGGALAVRPCRHGQRVAQPDGYFAAASHAAVFRCSATSRCGTTLASKASIRRSKCRRRRSRSSSAPTRTSCTIRLRSRSAS